MQQHRLAVEHARRGRSEEWEARTLGGLADALYAYGGLADEYRCFDECVQKARRRGGNRGVEAANLAMQGTSYFFLMRAAQPGIDLCLEAADRPTA